jgi:hypothetical protein
MAKRDMKKALGASLKAEEQAVRSRFEEAGTVLLKQEPVLRELPQPDAAVEIIGDNLDLPDSLDLPDNRFELVSRIKRRCMQAGIRANESEMLRAGLVALDAMPDRELERLFESLPRVKTNRAGRKLLFFTVHHVNAVKFGKPLQIKHGDFARKVIICHNVVTITFEKI